MRLARRRSERVYQRSDDWGAIARIYDLEHPACRGAELRFWHELATETGKTVLELAAGSGRVAQALARKGHRVTGLELSAGMLERAEQRRARLKPEAQDRLSYVQGDMAAFDLQRGASDTAGTFGLIFVGYNSFWLLNDEASQVKCLRCVRRHLAPGGRFVVDVFPPNQDDYSDESGIAQVLPTTMRGLMLSRIKDYTYDPATHLAVSDVRYYGSKAGVEQPSTVVAQFRYVMRIAPPEDVQALLEREGFIVEATYGSYGKDPLTPDSSRAIFVTRVPPPE